MTAGDMRMCNCASCGRLLLGSRETWREGLPPKVRGRMLDRPYCSDCLEVLLPTRGVAGPVEEASPGQENAVREMEDQP